MNEDDLVGCSLVLLIIVGLFGWLLIGNVAPAGGKATTKMTAKVLHDGEVIHLSSGGDIVTTFKDVHTYHLLQDRTETEAIGTYDLNMYGGVCGSTNWTIPK